MDKITLQSWLKVFYNDLVLTKILGMFDLEEQIALIPVCQRFQHIISDVIWKKKFHDLLIQKTNTKFEIGWKDPAVVAVVTKVSQANYDKRNVEQRELYEFLKYLSPHLKSLTVVSNIRFDRRTSYKGLVFNFPDNFENLQVLKYDGVILKDENIKTISEKCKRLKELCLKNAETKLTGRYLGELRNLETFCIDSERMTWSYETLVNICHLPLKNLQLIGILFGEKDTNFICDTGCLAGTLEMLKLSCHELPYKDALDIFRFSSKPFGLLQELHITGDSNVKSHHFDLISEKCLNLQRLFISADYFEVDNIKFPPNLKELYIDDCNTVSLESAWYILTEMNLSSLLLSNVDHSKMYNFNYFTALGCSLKTLKIIPFVHYDNTYKYFWEDIFENCSLDSFQQLESLTCNYLTYSHLDLISRKIPKIQYITINTDEMPGSYIFRFKNLKSLTLTSSASAIDISYFIEILETARELESLAITECKIKEDDSGDDARVPYIGSCSLRTLSIDYDNFLVCQPIWLDLLRLNLVKIEILCRCELFSFKFDLAFLLAVFEDADISANLDRFVIHGTFEDVSLKSREWFVEILHHPSIRKYLKRVRVNGCQIDTSLDKAQCLKRITWCLDNNADFTIELN